MSGLGRPIATEHGHLKEQVIDPATDLPAEFGGAGATPTLAAVLVVGNDPAGTAIVGTAGGAGNPGVEVRLRSGWGDGGNDTGSEIILDPGSGAGAGGPLELQAGASAGNSGSFLDLLGGTVDGGGGPAIVQAGSGAAGKPGAAAEVRGGEGDGNNVQGAVVRVGGGDNYDEGGTVVITAGDGSEDGNPASTSGATVSIAGGTPSDGGGGQIRAVAGNGGAGINGGPIILTAGKGDAGADVGASLILQAGDGTGGDGAVVATGSAFTFNGDPIVTPPASTVRVGAGVPSGAPTGVEVPLAYDTTLVTGGFYFWNGSAKVATIL